LRTLRRSAVWFSHCMHIRFPSTKPTRLAGLVHPPKVFAHGVQSVWLEAVGFYHTWLNVCGQHVVVDNHIRNATYSLDALLQMDVRPPFCAHLCITVLGSVLQQLGFKLLAYPTEFIFCSCSVGRCSLVDNSGVAKPEEQCICIALATGTRKIVCRMPYAPIDVPGPTDLERIRKAVTFYDVNACHGVVWKRWHTNTIRVHGAVSIRITKFGKHAGTGVAASVCSV